MAKIITICASSAFYKHVNEIADKLEEQGYKTIVPHNAAIMRKTKNYDVKPLKTWYDNPEDFTSKQQFMDMHFKEVEKADAILVINDDKPGKPDYIGPNGLMEMALAYYLKKLIYVLNAVKKDNLVFEEVYGMGCTILDGDVSKIKL